VTAVAFLPAILMKPGIVINVSCVPICLWCVNKPKSGSGDTLVAWTTMYVVVNSLEGLFVALS